MVFFIWTYKQFLGGERIMKNLRFVSLALAVLVLAPTFAACSSTTKSSTSAGSSAPAAPVTLKVLDGQSTTDTGIDQLIKAEVAKKYPNITLDWESVDWGTAFEPKMQQYMKSGMPDIIIGKGQDIATYAPQGVLADLTGESYLNNVLPAAVTSGSLNGKVYGVVFNCLYQGVYYNRKLFSDNNIAVPTTMAELNTVIAKFKSLNITPFATHFVDAWSIGNENMQFAINEVFNKTPDWGDQFRAGSVSFANSDQWKTSYEDNQLIYNNTWKNETFSLPETTCDARVVQGKAMDPSGSWSVTNFQTVDPNFDYGIFPFPNSTGNAKLIYEANLTLMKSATTKYPTDVDDVIGLISSDKSLDVAMYNLTKSDPMLKNVEPTFKDPSMTDINKYAAAGQIVDAAIGNNQLVWGGFQDQQAADIATWLQGKETLKQALAAADGRKAKSKP
jgi:ABC-type glycerol-3-phosphate transport system substrate-binding protein